MKKIIITAFAFLIASSTFAQDVKLGIKASPSLAWNRVTVPKLDPTDWNGLAFRFGAGAFLDFMFSDNYALSTGVNYTTKGSGIEKEETDDKGETFTRDYKYSLQYLEIPISLKLFTNDIADDIKLYFQVGPTLNVNLSASIDDEKSYKEDNTNPDSKTINYTEHFSLFDIGLLVSSGIEMQMGDATFLVLGLTYNRGLLNQDADYKDSSPSGYILKNDYVSIDVGLKF